MDTLKLLEEEKVMENFDNFLNYHLKGLTNDTFEKNEQLTNESIGDNNRCN